MLLALPGYQNLAGLARDGKSNGTRVGCNKSPDAGTLVTLTDHGTGVPKAILVTGTQNHIIWFQGFDKC